MAFPFYHLYQAAITQRNLLILFVAALVITHAGIWLLVDHYKPAWRESYIWIFGVGGYYATMAGLVVLYFAGAAGH